MLPRVTRPLSEMPPELPGERKTVLKYILWARTNGPDAGLGRRGVNPCPAGVTQ